MTASPYAAARPLPECSPVRVELEALRRAVASLTQEPSQLQCEELEFLRHWARGLRWDELRHGNAGSRHQTPVRTGVLPPTPPPPPLGASRKGRGGGRPVAAGVGPPSRPHANGGEPPPVVVHYPPETWGLSAGPELANGLKVFIATPAYGGNVTVDYMTSVIHLVTQLKEVSWQLQLVAGESIITVGRNNAVMEFLSSDCTHLLFIDADVSFAVETIRGLLALDQDVALVPYPAKNLNETKMQEMAARREKPARLRDGLHYVLHAQVDKVQAALDANSRYAQIDAGPTGCMLIRRGVFDRLREAYPNQWCRLRGTHAGRPVRYEVWWRFFDTMVGEEGEFLGEDIAFCRRWRDIGGTVWADLASEMGHVGRHAFTGSVLDDDVLRAEGRDEEYERRRAASAASTLPPR